MNLLSMTPVLPVSNKDLPQELDRPLVLAKIPDGRRIITLIDTGSPVNIMSEKIYLNYFRNLPIKRSAAENVCDIHQNPVQLKGEIQLTITLGDRQFSENVWVAGGINVPCHLLLSYPACRRNHILVDPVCERLLVRGKEVKFYKGPLPHSGTRNTSVQVDNVSRLNESNEGDCMNEARVNDCVSETGSQSEFGESGMTVEELLASNMEAVIKNRYKVNLAPGEGRVMLCEVDRSLEGKDVLVLTEKQEVKGLSVMPSLNKVMNGQIEVEVRNDRGGPLELDKGVKLASVESFLYPIKVVQETKSQVLTLMAQQQSEIEALEERKQKMLAELNPLAYPEAREKLCQLLLRYKDVVALKGDTLGLTSKIEHTIKVPHDMQPLYIPAYRVAHSQREAIDKEVEAMLKDEIIEPSHSPWSFPLLCVPKKDGTYRIVVDFRQLNKATISDPYPVPSMRDLIANVGQKKIFTTIDLLMGFLQIPLEETSKPLTAFTTSSGRYQYRRMPFGLKSSPTTFVRLMDIVLTGLLGKDVYCYIDDLIIASNTIEEHLELLEKVLQRLQAANLKLKLSKCKFLQKEVVYLGHTLSSKGVEVNQEKIVAIQNFPQPRDKKAIQSFLGVTGFYRSFIKSYAHMAAPLTDLLKETAEFVWREPQQQAFEVLKASLVNPPVLALPDFEQEFFIATDASDVGLGACLMQRKEGKYCAIAYYSRKLRPSEKNYSVTDREALAVIESLKHFRYIVFGYPITLYTDHTACLELFKNPNMSGKRARWFLTAKDYEIQFKYLPGRVNYVADALSRYTPNGNNNATALMGSIMLLKFSKSLSADKFIREQKGDPELAEIRRYIAEGCPENKKEEMTRLLGCPVEEVKLVGDILVRDTILSNSSIEAREVRQQLVPKKLIVAVLETVHDRTERAHPGRDETQKQAKLHYYWRSLNKDCDRYVKNCLRCNECKGVIKSPAPLGAYPIPNGPFDRMAIDLLGGLDATCQGNKYILVCIDSLTRFTELIPLKNKTAKECAAAIYDKIICRYTAPKVIISDNGLEFNNSLLNQLCEKFEVNKVNIMAYRPASNGLVERANKKILECLRLTIGQSDPNWDVRLPSVQMSLNTSVHSSTKEIPLKALMGYDPRLPFEWLAEPIQPVYNEDHIKVRLNNLKLIHTKVRENLKKSQAVMLEKQSQKAKIDTYNKGDLVFLKEDVLKGANYKLAQKYRGPFIVERMVGPNKVELKEDTKGKTMVTHVDKVKKYSETSEIRKKRVSPKKVTFNPQVRVRRFNVEKKNRGRMQPRFKMHLRSKNP